MDRFWRSTGWVILLASAGMTSACDRDPESTAVRSIKVAASVEPPSIMAALTRLSEFRLLRAGLRDTGLAPLLANASAVTLLAPRDSAFALMPADARAALFAPQARPALTGALRAMMIPRIIRAEELRTLIRDGGGSARIASLSGAPLTFTADGDELIVTTASGARATMGSQEFAAGNGAIYVLDRWIG